MIWIYLTVLLIIFVITIVILNSIEKKKLIKLRKNYNAETDTSKPSPGRQSSGERGTDESTRRSTAPDSDPQDEGLDEGQGVLQTTNSEPIGITEPVSSPNPPSNTRIKKLFNRRAR